MSLNPYLTSYKKWILYPYKDLQRDILSNIIQNSQKFYINQRAERLTNKTWIKILENKEITLINSWDNKAL